MHLREKILAIDEGTILFNAGSEVGLNEGQIFDGFSREGHSLGERKGCSSLWK